MADENKTPDEERLDALESIASNAEESRDDDFDEVEVEEDDVEEESDEDEPDDEEQDDESDDEEEETDEVEQDDEPEEQLIKVGEEEVPLSKLIERYQTPETPAAPVEAEQPEEQAGQTVFEKAQERYNAARDKLSRAAVDVDDEAIKEATDELTQAQSDLIRLQMPSAEAIQQNALRAMRMETLQERLRLPKEQGGQADIMGDERALTLAQMEFQKLVKNEADVYNIALYQKAADNVRKFLGWDTDGFDAKREKKKKIVDIQTAQKKAPSPKNKKKEPTREEFKAQGIAELAKQRGQVL